MARKHIREPQIDTELAYAYAKTDRLHDMEDFLGMTNVADILVVGEKCFEDELYQAAKLLFTSISNWARLATTLIYLGENQAAVESARKAGNTQVWKQVHAACIEKSEFRLVGLVLPHDGGVADMEVLLTCIAGSNMWFEHRRSCGSCIARIEDSGFHLLYRRSCLLLFNLTNVAAISMKSLLSWRPHLAWSALTYVFLSFPVSS
jgi:hypothetical protein